MFMLGFASRNYTSRGHLAEHMLKLNGGVINLKLFVQPLCHRLQDASLAEGGMSAIEI